MPASRHVSLGNVRGFIRKRTICTGICLSALVFASASGPVVTYTGSSNPKMAAAESTPFRFFLVASADQPLVDALGGVDPVKGVDVRQSPFDKEAQVPPGWRLGMYRRQGPHMIALQSPTLSRHLAELERDVPRIVPPDFTGPVVIDYEPWWALWERTPNTPSAGAVDALDGDYKDDWRDYINEHKPHLVQGLSPEQAETIYKRTYESFVRTFLLATYYKCKQLRPRAQWGFYNYPQVLIVSDLTPPGVQGYGDLTHRASRLNDENGWLYETVDFVAPRIYPSRMVVEHNPTTAERQAGRISRSVHEAWLSSMVRESARLAKGKPVYPLHSAIYYTRHDFEHQPVTQFHHEEVFRVLSENGAAGVIIWHAVKDRDGLDQWNSLWQNQLKPAGINANRSINGPGSGS